MSSKIRDIKDIIDMNTSDLKGLSVGDIKKLTTKMGSAVNKRVKRSNEAGKTTPAIRSLEKSGGKISVKGITTRAEAVKEFRRAQKFLTSKTGGLQQTKRASYHQYENLNPRKTSGAELKKAVSELSKVANRRLKALKQLEAQGISSPALEAWKNAGLGTFGAGRKFDIDVLRAEYKRVSQFLAEPTSQAGYTKRLLHKINKAIERKTKVQLNDEMMNELFSLYSKIREASPFVGREQYKNYKYELFRQIGEMMNDDMDPDDILSQMMDTVEQINEEIQTRGRVNTSEFFTIEA